MDGGDDAKGSPFADDDETATLRGGASAGGGTARPQLAGAADSELVRSRHVSFSPVDSPTQQQQPQPKP